MKAPNGKDTNLTEKQWVQVRTPSFKAWFGDWENDPDNSSKVVDENGEPKVVYHGTEKKFTTFNTKKTATPQFWFTDTKDLIEKGEVGASGNGAIIDAYLDIKNPAGWKEEDNLGIQQIIDRGFDGKILEDGDEKTYVVFESTQIKSATNNNGMFDSNNPNILFQEDGKPVTIIDFPNRPDIDEIQEKYKDDPSANIFKKMIEENRVWHKELEEWLKGKPDLLQFGDEKRVAVVHKNTRPDEGHWRVSTFGKHNDEWIPSGHSSFDTKIKAIIFGIGSKNYRPDILFQEAVEKINNGTLAVLHNITPARLAAIEDIGGLPSPSLAITKPNIPFEQFGNITLIADPSVATRAMEENRLYDRDVWSPTVPRAEWKINEKMLHAFDAKIRDAGTDIGERFGGSETFRRSDINEGLESVIYQYKRTLGAQLAFLKENSIKYELQYKKPTAPLTFPLDVIEENIEYFKSTNLDGDSLVNVKKYLEPLIIKSLEKKFSDALGDDLTRSFINEKTDKYTRFGVLDRVFHFAKTYDKDAVVFDEYGTKESIESTIKQHDEEFSLWVKEKVKGAYSNPKIKIGSKKYDYTADNILKWMRTQSERASQETMTYG